MEANGHREKWAFYLKKKGNFRAALTAYAHEYAQSIGREYPESLGRETPLVAEICFKEMFDSALLLCLQGSRLFETKADLLDAIRKEIVEALRSQEVYDKKSEDLFRRYQRRLFPRGRGKPFFSVDARLLLRNERALLETPR